MSHNAIKDLWFKICNSFNCQLGMDCTKPKFLPSPSSSKDLPIEIVADILSRLPVKTLVQFTTICKSWYSLIKTHHFITTHLNRSISLSKNTTAVNNSHLLLIPCKFKPSPKNYSSVVICPETFDVLDNLVMPICTRNMNVNIVNSCNGLICLSEYYPNAFGHVLYLWNLSIRKFKTLPLADLIRHHFIVYKRVLGFGYDYRTNDFKIVRILYYKEDVAPEIEVYSLRKDSWRRIGVNVDFIAHCSSAAVPFVNGAVHWMAQPFKLGSLGKYMFPVNHFIMSFHIGEEVFQKIALPPICRGVEACVMELKGLLSLYVPFASEIHTFEGCYIWVMGMYGVVASWSRQFTVKVSAPMRIIPLGLTKNGKLVVEKDEEEVVSLDLESLQVRDLEFNAGSFVVDTCYMESLALLNEVI